jgi:hypothetical protein
MAQPLSKLLFIKLWIGQLLLPSSIRSTLQIPDPDVFWIPGDACPEPFSAYVYFSIKNYTSARLQTVVSSGSLILSHRLVLRHHSKHRI